MTRKDRLQEASRQLQENYESVWVRREVPQQKVQLDMLLLDIIGELLGSEDDNRGSLLQSSRFAPLDDQPAAQDISHKIEEILQEFKPNADQLNGDFSRWLQKGRENSGDDSGRGTGSGPRRVRRNSKSTPNRRTKEG